MNNPVGYYKVVTTPGGGRFGLAHHALTSSHTLRCFMLSTSAGKVTKGSLPRPFYGRPWSGQQREAAHALWDWYSQIPRLVADRFDTEVAMDWCSSAAKMVTEGEQPDFIDDQLWHRVDQACSRFDLSYHLLGKQMEASHVYAGAIRFTDAAALNDYIESHPFAHAWLLAQLGEVDYSWQREAVRNLAQGFFFANHLAHLPRDLERDYLFIPTSNLQQAGVTVDQLRAGKLDRPLKNVLWKFHIRARDAFAQGLSLLKDLPWLFRGPFKRAWLGGLEVLRTVERYDYDVWNQRIEFSVWQRAQIVFQALAGRTTFRSR